MPSFSDITDGLQDALSVQNIAMVVGVLAILGLVLQTQLPGSQFIRQLMPFSS